LPTTADADHTIAGALPWLAALLQGAGMAAILRSRRAAQGILAVVALNGLLLAVVGAFVRFSGSEELLGLIAPPEPSYFFATFFYKNHWAAYGALSAAAAFTLVLANFRAALAGDPHARGRALLFAASGLLTVVTLPLPGSRSGLVFAVVLILSSAALLLRAWHRAGFHRNVGAGLVVLAVAAILGFGWTAYAPRVQEDMDRTRREFTRTADDIPNLRLQLSRDTWQMARDRPWFGWGPGTFEVVFPRYRGSYLRDESGRPQARFEAAHDDWLQLLAEVGLIGSVILVLPAVWSGLSGFQRGNVAGRWALVMCAVVAVYACADFPFQNPAVLTLWVVLLSCAGRMTSAQRSAAES
jgi:O-antigen ligase